MKDILESGFIKQKSGGQSIEVPFEIRVLGERFLDQIMDLQQVILRNLSRPDLLEPFPPLFMRRHFEEKGRVLGVFSQDRLVAFRAVYYPEIDEKEWCLGRDLGMSESKMKEGMANLQMVCVHPDFRGNSLARRMNRIALLDLKEQGKYRHIFATVHPFNYWNVLILLDSGFVIKKMTYKYDGKLRYIVYQDILAEKPVAAEGSKKVALLNIDKQKELLEEGYIGVELIQDEDNNFFVVMTR